MGVSYPKMLTTGPNGITAKARKQVVAEMIGARMKIALSAAVGMMSSFSASLIPSASPWSRPNGPTRFGPTRCCILATTRRSAQIITRVLTTRNPKMATAFAAESHHGVSARASVTLSSSLIPVPLRLPAPARRSRQALGGHPR